MKGEDAPKQGDIQPAGGLSVDVDMNIPEGQKAGKFDVAVIIGNRNHAASGSPNVDFANRDAQVMKEYLIRTVGYDPANILYAEDAPLSKFNEFFGGERDYRGRLFRFKNVSPALVKVKKEFRGPANAVLITSAVVDQVSTWYREKKHSLFTYYFLKGLQGEADADRNGRITVGEMDASLKERVPCMARRLTGTEQQPVVTGNRADVIAVLKR